MGKDDLRREIREAEDDLVALLKWKRGQSLERPFDRMGEDKAICRALGLLRSFKDFISK